MDERRVAVENDAALGETFTLPLTLDGALITTVDLAIQEAGEVRPLTVWTAHPGPKTPTVRGEYFVFARTQANPKRAICLGKLVMF
jgi:hypothetical protein